jgi:hypothetical protein
MIAASPRGQSLAVARREAVTIIGMTLMRMPKIPAGRATDAQPPQAAGERAEGTGVVDAAGRAPGAVRSAPARRWLLATSSALARHWLLTALLTVGLVLRVLAMVAYRPVLFYIDSTKYLYHAAGNDPVGYRVPLRLILLVANLDTVAGVQHLIGLAMGVVIYAVLVRRGSPRWLAALAVAPVLLDAYELQIEQTVMPDVWLEALIVAGLALLLWRPRAPLWTIAAAGAAFGLAATFAQVGECLVLPAVIYVLAAADGWRRAVGRAVVTCVAFAVPIVAYMSICAAVTGHFWLSDTGTNGLYGRVAMAADCATLRLPASERALCPTAAQKAALGDDGLEHNPASPRYNTHLSHGAASHAASAFTRAVLAQQPVNVAAAITKDTLKLFAVARVTDPGDTPISRWQFQTAYPYYTPHATRAEVGAAVAQFGGGAPAVSAPLARFLRSYQLHGGYTPGPLYALAVLAGLAGSLALAGPASRRSLRRWHGRGRSPGPAGERRELALACLLFFATGVIVLLVSDVFEFSWRYQLPALVTLPPAGALGLVVVAGLVRSRRAETAPP